MYRLMRANHTEIDDSKNICRSGHQLFHRYFTDFVVPQTCPAIGQRRWVGLCYGAELGTSRI